MVLLPGCTCCGFGCCRDGLPPNTVTLSLNEVPAGLIAGPNLVAITATSCSGSGFLAVAAEPYGDPATKAGAITKVQVQSHGSGYAIVGREEPTLAVSNPAAGLVGSGLEADWVFTQNDGCIVTWSALSATVTNGGTGWTDGETVVLEAAAPGITVTPGDAIVYTKRIAPTVSLTVESENGSGAVLSASLTETTSGGRPVWQITAVNIDSDGTGYADGDLVTASQEGDESVYFVGAVEVGSGGAIESVSVDYSHDFYESTDEAESLTLGTPGEFYSENPSLPPIVPEITVSVSQLLPSDGTGATFSPTVTTSPGATFGQIATLAITSGGSGYLAYELLESLNCATFFDSKTIVLRKDPAYAESVEPCERVAYGCNWAANVVFASNNPVYANTQIATYESDSPLTQCDSFSSLGMTSADDLTATLSTGGAYVAGIRPISPASVEFTFRGKTVGGARIDPSCGVEPTIWNGVNTTRAIYCYPQTQYQYPENTWVGTYCLSPSPAQQVLSTNMCCAYNRTTVAADFCASEGSSPEIPLSVAGYSETQLELTDATVSVDLRFDCPCIYTADVVSVDEEVSRGIVPAGENFYGFLWVARRTSVWTAAKPIQEKPEDQWPQPSDYEWRLLFVAITFRFYEPAVLHPGVYPDDWTGTYYPPVSGTASGVEGPFYFQTGYQDFGEPRSPTELPPGEQVGQRNWWIRVSEWSGIGDDVFPTSDPDVNWTINWGDGNVPS